MTSFDKAIVGDVLDLFTGLLTYFLSRGFQTPTQCCDCRQRVTTSTYKSCHQPAVYVIAIVGGVAAAVAFKEVGNSSLSN